MNQLKVKIKSVTGDFWYKEGEEYEVREAISPSDVMHATVLSSDYDKLYIVVRGAKEMNCILKSDCEILSDAEQVETNDVKYFDEEKAHYSAVIRAYENVVETMTKIMNGNIYYYDQLKDDQAQLKNILGSPSKSFPEPGESVKNTSIKDFKNIFRNLTDEQALYIGIKIIDIQIAHDFKDDIIKEVRETIPDQILQSSRTNISGIDWLRIFEYLQLINMQSPSAAVAVDEKMIGIGFIEIICKVAKSYGRIYAIYNEPIRVKGQFNLSCLHDFLFDNAESDTLSAIDMQDDDDNQIVKIIAELTELGSGVGMDSVIAYELKSWEFCN